MRGPRRLPKGDCPGSLSGTSQESDEEAKTQEQEGSAHRSLIGVQSAEQG